MVFISNKNLKEFAEKLEIIPVNGQPNSKVYYCNEGYGLIKYKTDKFGFRNKNDKPIWPLNCVYDQANPKVAQASNASTNKSALIILYQG